MRKNTTTKKLDLKKITITALNSEEAVNVKGGSGEYSLNNPRCSTQLSMQPKCYSNRASC